MEFRKLIEFGKGSFVVSLPKPWVLKNNLKRGNMLSMDLNGPTITISTDYIEEKYERKSISINADNKKIGDIETEIVTAYLTNYDIIEIMSKKVKNDGEEIKKMIMDLAGLEILEQTNSKITAKFLMDLREISLDSLIRRMDNITRSLIIDAIECTSGSKNYESIRKRDKDVNRLHFLIIRTIRQVMGSSKHLKKIDKTMWQLHTYLIIGEKLEKIADRQKRIARCLECLTLSKKFKEEIKKAYTAIQDSYLEVMKAYYQNDKNLAKSLEKSNRERISACDILLSSDISKEYKMIKKKNTESFNNYVHEHMFMTEIITNLKAMATSVKLIARVVMNNDIEEKKEKS